MNYTIKLENQVREFITSEILTSKTKGLKAIDDVTRNLWPLFVKYNIEFDEFINDYNSDLIIDVEFLNNPGIYNWIDYVIPKYKDFARELSKLRPIGLGTPNAAPGEAEFMILVLSKESNKPVKGDIEINGSLKEFKDESPRVQSKSVQGKEFRITTVELCKKYGLNPNTNKTKFVACELTENGNKKEYWDIELNKLSTDKKTEFLSEWLELTNCFTDEESLKSAKSILIDGNIDRELLKKELCKYFFKNQLPYTPGDNLIMFIDDVVVNVKYDVESYFKMFDDELLIPTSNYIRINQNFPIAWYYSYNKNKINEYKLI